MPRNPQAQQQHNSVVSVILILYPKPKLLSLLWDRNGLAEIAKIRVIECLRIGGVQNGKNVSPARKAIADPWV
jgi:hypothetical protein